VNEPVRDGDAVFIVGVGHQRLVSGTA
jgi:hypothetical protein